MRGSWRQPLQFAAPSARSPQPLTTRRWLCSKADRLSPPAPGRHGGSGGRSCYAGAGTSGGSGGQDGSELPPTYDWPPDRLVFAMAGGLDALVRSAEQAEDKETGGAEATTARENGDHDC